MTFSVVAILAATIAVGADTDAVFVGAGDIAYCEGKGGAGSSTAEATAKLLDKIPGTVFTLGDNAYEDGTAAEFSRCYQPTWGRHRARTRPAAGNHDYNTKGAKGYYDYFGVAAGDRGKGYYSFDLGGWHVVALNSNCRKVGGCERGSAQELWLREDLASHPARCTLAYWHHPRFSSGDHGDDDSTQAFWEVLYANGAELVLVGHDHDYERFAPQNPSGGRDDQNGIVQIVVGTGGVPLRSISSLVGNSLVRDSDSHGVLKLTLKKDSYDFEFVPAVGSTFTDRGSGRCH